jgi:hypothetical protein
LAGHFSPCAYMLISIRLLPQPLSNCDHGGPGTSSGSSPDFATTGEGDKWSTLAIPCTMPVMHATPLSGLPLSLSPCHQASRYSPKHACTIPTQRNTHMCPERARPDVPEPCQSTRWPRPGARQSITRSLVLAPFCKGYRCITHPLANL